MEANQKICTNCSKELPNSGYFCGACLTQFKCKSCDTFLESDYIGCINCGTPKEIRGNNISSSKNSNTFRLHETKTDRIIEATFSDTVGKDLAAILKDASANRIKAIGSKDELQYNLYDDNDKKTDDNFTDVELIKDVSKSNESKSQKETTETKQFSPNEYPTLLAIAMNNLPSSEVEWIVVYAFYASNYGQKTFNREDLIKMYNESDRYNKYTTRRDLSKNIKRSVQSGYINPLSTGYSILDAGKIKVKEIISRTSSSTPRQKNHPKSKKEKVTEEVKKTKKTSNSPSNLKRLSNIDFEPNDRESLISFFGKYSPKNDKERNLLFVYYLEEILKISDISFDHIYTCYDAIQELKISENLPQTVRNTASQTGWIETKNSRILTTIKGRNQIKSWNKEKQ